MVGVFLLTRYRRQVQSKPVIPRKMARHSESSKTLHPEMKNAVKPIRMRIFKYKSYHLINDDLNSLNLIYVDLNLQSIPEKVFDTVLSEHYISDCNQILFHFLHHEQSNPVNLYFKL